MSYAKNTLRDPAKSTMNTRLVLADGTELTGSSFGHYVIRRTAIDCGVPLLTDRQLARAVIEALRQKTQQQLEVVTLGDHGSGVSLL